jgi:O-antigen/teichoic acid export membrane protein
VVGYSRDKGVLILVVGATTFIATLIMAVEWCFRAFERMEYQGGLRALRGLGALGLGTAVLLAGGGILGVALAQLVIAFGFFVAIYTVVRRRFARPAWRLNWLAFGALTRRALPFGLGIFATVLLFNVDTVMLSHMKGDVATGLYNLAYRLVDGLKLLPVAFCAALYPPLSHTFRHDRKALNDLITKAWYLMAIVALPAAVGTTLLADRLIVLLFGARYEAAGPILALLVWAGALMFLLSVLTTALAAIDQQPAGAGLVFLGTTINVFLNWFFIPRWGAWGASLALVVAMVIMTAGGLLYISRLLAIPRWGSLFRYASMVAATAAMAVGLWSLRGAHLAVLVLAGSAIYTVAIFATRGLRWTDLEVLRRPASGESIHVAS